MGAIHLSTILRSKCRSMRHHWRLYVLVPLVFDISLQVLEMTYVNRKLPSILIGSFLQAMVTGLIKTGLL